MELDTLKNECQSLRTIRERWQALGWPLDRIDGENGIIECLYKIRNLMPYEALATKAANGQTIEELIEDLEDFYRTALQAWDEFRTVFECQDTQRHLMRWPEGTYPANIRRAARFHFWELVTTSRYSVREIEAAGELIAVHFDPLSPLGKRHSVSLAMMVCIKDAIEALEQIEATADSENDQANLDEACAACEHAAFWLANLETWNVASRELNHAIKKARAETAQKIKSERSKQAMQAAKKLRTAVTPELVASHFKANPSKLQKTLVLELTERYQVSARTVATRLKEAKTLNLMQ